MIQTYWDNGRPSKHLVWCRNPVFALEMIQTEMAILYASRVLSRNPVFALEMIQTEGPILGGRTLTFLSQSSIRPGDDSDFCGRKRL